MKNEIKDKKDARQRLEVTHPFQFSCGMAVDCFTNCCQDITIVLTPYDVMRMKKNIGISSDEFIEKYTIIFPKKGLLIPLVILKMNETDKKCPFVSTKGCKIYTDRPWPCRMYPLDINADGTYSLITDSTRCHGLKEKLVNKISDWLSSQEIEAYEEMNEYLSSLTIQLQSHDFDIDNPKIQQMIIMALYNLDKFREFVFKSSFLDRLEVEPEIVEAIKTDDYELLKFAYDWIKFGLFGKKVFWVKEKRDE